MSQPSQPAADAAPAPVVGARSDMTLTAVRVEGSYPVACSLRFRFVEDGADAYLEWTMRRGRALAMAWHLVRAAVRR